MLNLAAAYELLELYKTITEAQIENVFNQLKQIKEDVTGNDVLGQITGFGSNASCRLCQEAIKIAGTNDPRMFCNHCVYNDGYYDNFYCIDTTYSNICNAENAKDIFTALQARALYLEQTIKNLENEQDNSKRN